jgi:hypothetical protein
MQWGNFPLIQPAPTVEYKCRIITICLHYINIFICKGTKCKNTAVVFRYFFAAQGKNIAIARNESSIDSLFQPENKTVSCCFLFSTEKVYYFFPKWLIHVFLFINFEPIYST